jgi:hypothetical protein
MTLGPTTQGHDYNFFAKPTITDTSFPSSPQVMINLATHVQGFSIAVTDGYAIEYSFNGTTLHGDLVPAEGTSSVQFNNRPVSKIFFRALGADPVTVRVEAWAVR